MSVPLHRVRFLVVDDNPRAIDLVKTILRGFGATKVDEARTVTEGKARIKVEPADIVLLDYQMGDEDGVALARYLRRDPESPAPFVPIIMLTGHADLARVRAARDAGVNEFCIKPVTPADLMKRIVAVIERPRPFIRGGDYVGPDRRRGQDPKYKGPERRAPSR